MATVYLAEDLKHHRKVALKVLRPELSAVLGAERFLKEIHLTASLQHPHLLPLFDSGEAEGLLFYVMPFVEGESLRERLAREKQLGVEEAVRLVTQVAGALDYAHRRGVLHRDIKPENILLEEGQALIADFGIALALRRAGGNRLTETGLSLGTPQYMSPEQATGDRELDARSDIYSLACVLYELLAGEPPHTGPTIQAVVAKVLTATVTPIGKLRPTVPVHVAAALDVALAKLPADRFATAAQFADALTRPGAAAPLVASRTVDIRPPMLRRALPWAVAVVSLAVAIGLGLSRSAPKVETGGRVMTTIEPPEGYEFADEFSLALSPDGRQLAFVALGPDGQRSLWLRPLDTLGARRLPGTEGAQSAFWSPDGRQLGFFARDTLSRLQLASSAVSTLCPAPRSLGGAWSRDGTIVFAALGGLFRTTPRGGCALALSDSGFRPDVFQRPLFLDDGAEVVFSLLGQNQLRAFNLRTGTEALLGRGYSPIRADRGLLVFGGLAANYLLFAQRVGGSPPRLRGEPFPLPVSVAGGSGNLSATAGGRGRLVYLEMMGDRAPRQVDRGGATGDSLNLLEGTWTHRVAHRRPLLASGGDVVGLWLSDLRRNLSTRLDTGTGVYPVFSPDDRRLAYWSWGPGRPCTVRVYDLERGTDSLLLRSCRIPLDWSPHGEALLLGPTPSWVADSTGRVGIVALDLSDGSVRAAENFPPSATDARYSPDGRWIAYESAESGTPEIYVTSASGRAPAVRVSAAGGSNPRWRGDSRELFFLGPLNTMFAASVAPGPSLRIGTPRLLFRFDGRPFQVEVTPDGRQFLISPRWVSRNAVVLDGWLSEVP
jgi:serine/threonine-protein kinase